MFAPSRYGSSHHAQLASASSVSCESLEPYSNSVCCHASQRIASSDTTSESWFRVVSGAVRQYGVHPDGRRQILDLLLPGDCFGFTGWDENWLTVEAILEGTKLARYSRREIETQADAGVEVVELMCGLASQAICRLQKQLLVLGRVTAAEKVGSFLVELSKRLPNNSGDDIVLPFTRYDIADYLAISVETVRRRLHPHANARSFRIRVRDGA
jgi:CRP/FNR family transcriptional regulator, nitrogen fixation regulation protein